MPERYYVLLLSRESETLVDVYTLQLLYVFVESLAIAQGDDSSLGKFGMIGSLLIKYEVF